MTEIILKKIEEYARSVGFQEIKVTELSKMNFYTSNLKEFIKNKFYGDMIWMKKKAKIREHPKNMWNEAKSSLVFGLNYGPNYNPLFETKDVNKGYISIYARRKDYHKVIKSKLKAVSRFIEGISDIKIKVYVDTAPLMEKPLAEKANIGWIGKHTNLVSRNYGSWLFLGIILTNYNFKQSKKTIKSNCGTCKECNNICPTSAFISPYKLDARKCISYLTIEHKSHIDLEFRDAIGNRIFGCDDCLAVCPWNKFAKQYSDINMCIDNKLTLPSLKVLIKIDDRTFRNMFAGTPIRRTGYIRFLRNILIAVGNSDDISLVNSVIKKLDNPNALVRSMAVWALFKLSKKKFIEEKRKRFFIEKDDCVKKEWELE